MRTPKSNSPETFFLDRTKGMTWYYILKVLLVIRAVWGPLQQWAIYVSEAATMQLTHSEYCDIFPSITAFGYLNALGHSVLSIVMFRHMRKESSKSIQDSRNIIIFAIVMAVCQTIAIYSDYILLDLNDITLIDCFLSNLGMIFGACVWFLPTYFYLKKRFYSPHHPYSNYPLSFTPSSIGPEKIIPVRLLGVSDQAQRDQIVAEYMGQIVNPYTGNCVSSEAEWNIYLHGLPEAAPQTCAEPVSRSISELAPKPEPDCAKCTAEKPVFESKPDYTESASEESSSILKFCRFCGKPIKPDSKFCEYCGKSLK